MSEDKLVTKIACKSDSQFSAQFGVRGHLRLHFQHNLLPNGSLDVDFEPAPVTQKHKTQENCKAEQPDDKHADADAISSGTCVHLEWISGGDKILTFLGLRSEPSANRTSYKV